jgi:hypothetical protein
MTTSKLNLDAFQVKTKIEVLSGVQQLSIKGGSTTTTKFIGIGEGG